MMSGRRDHEVSRNVIKQEERFFSRLLSKENSRVNSSSRVYYYGGAAVPFVWETSPGTPKHALFSESSHPPPLTPPPSYYSSNKLSIQKQNSAATSKQNFLATLFCLKKNNSIKNLVSPSFSSSSTSSSSSSSWRSSFSSSSAKKVVIFRKKCHFSCTRSPVPYVKDDGEAAEEEEFGSSPMCYGSKRREFKGGKRGLSSSLESLKRALFSVLSHGSNGPDLINDRK